MKTYAPLTLIGSVRATAMARVAFTACLTSTALLGCADEICFDVGCAGSGGAAGSTTGESGSGATSTSTPSSSPSASSTESGGGAGGQGGSGAGGDGAGGDGGGPPAGCELIEGEPVTGDDCAIFVNRNPEQEVADGTRAKPFRTIEQALELAAEQGKPIYVCAAGTPYDEEVTATRSVSLVGGFGCETWAWSAAGRTEWIAEAGSIPLRFAGDGEQYALAGFSISAAAAVEPGQSSIAVFVDRAQLEIDRCDLRADVGQDGVDDLEPLQEASAQDGSSEESGGCISQTSTPGRMGGQNTCDGSIRNGGAGGDGLDGTVGGSGVAGSPSAGGGSAGAAQGAGPGGQCSVGGPGDNGQHGEPASGAGPGDNGQLASTAFLNASGKRGTAGTPGAGGGGGGGASSCAGAGPAGGSGGAGGCGGLAGDPGGGGGSSIGIASFNAAVSIARSTVTTSDGGVGGDGAGGQFGQPGGAGGAPSGSGACAGGNGGNGGDGSAAGGGRGGHSVGIVFTGQAPSVEGGSVTFDNGSPGIGGAGGIVGDRNTGGPGADGASEMLLEVDGV